MSNISLLIIIACYYSILTIVISSPIDSIATLFSNIPIDLY